MEMKRRGVVAAVDVTLADVLALYLRALLYLGILATVVAVPVLLAWHARVVYMDEHAHVMRHKERASDLMRSFCEHDASRRMGMRECVDADAFLKRNLEREILERVIDEHLEHLPLVHYCRTTATCRDTVVLFMDTMRASFFWLAMAALPCACLVLFLLWRFPGRAAGEATQVLHSYTKGVTLPTTRDTRE
jgi:hypothetical protein